MNVPKLSINRAQLIKWLPFGGVATILLASIVAMVLTWPQSNVTLAAGNALPPALRGEYNHLVKSLQTLEARQHTLQVQVVAPSELDRELSLISLDAEGGHFIAARADMRSLKLALTNWNLELDGGPHPGVVVGGVQLPILLYHYPPPNFDAQLTHLDQAGYTVIDLDQALLGMSGGPLPPKPVVITFDDGFSAQMSAYQTLKRHNMKATFYIIDGGPESQWCIGAGRRYGDPLQPPGGCGDSYLSWDQVRMLDRSGLITIGGHTINHRNLSSLSAADQRYEIENGKKLLEQQLGHTVRHFAYPYGQYNDTTIQIVQEAGYQTAVTTIPGMNQGAGPPFTLRRERNAMTLP